MEQVLKALDELDDAIAALRHVVRRRVSWAGASLRLSAHARRVGAGRTRLGFERAADT